MVMGIGQVPPPLADNAYARPPRGREELDCWAVDGGVAIDVGTTGF
jgi:hypothetical protein